VHLDCQPDRPEGHGPAVIVNVCGSSAWQALVAWPGGDCAGLCRPQGHSLVEIMNVCGSPAWEAFQAQSGGVEVLKACTGFRGVGLVEQSSCNAYGLLDWQASGSWPSGD
jgi:hypothetical protein